MGHLRGHKMMNVIEKSKENIVHLYKFQFLDFSLIFSFVCEISEGFMSSGF